MNPYKLDVTLGSNEFHGDGPKDDVREDYRMFIEACRGQASLPPQVTPDPPDQRNGGGINGVTDPPTDGVLARAYTTKDGVVSLKALPKTNTVTADMVVLLMYGYLKLKDEDQLTANAIMTAAQQSGRPIERVDYALGGHADQYIVTTGRRRGKRYGLNNPGINHAQELLNHLFE